MPKSKVTSRLIKVRTKVTSHGDRRLSWTLHILQSPVSSISIEYVYISEYHLIYDRFTVLLIWSVVRVLVPQARRVVHCHWGRCTTTRIIARIQNCPLTESLIVSGVALAGAVDRTWYGSTRISPKSYFVHHTQRITKAAVMHDAKAILKQVVVLKEFLKHTGLEQVDAVGGSKTLRMM